MYTKAAVMLPTAQASFRTLRGLSVKQLAPGIVLLWVGQVSVASQGHCILPLDDAPSLTSSRAA